MDLSEKKCVPCEGGAKPLSRAQAGSLLKELADWRLAEDGKSIFAEWAMKDFLAAVRFVEAVAGVAKKEGHHPDLHLTGYRNLKIVLWTHAIGGLSENDFILAAKINKLPKSLKIKRA